ncbi:lipopolysaccharide biosynthesis protein [Roseibium hamelinense]|nr:lipopolysaccharide biosynthesis protein [Roseibium hamelinense]
MGVVNSPDSAGRMAVTTFAVRVGGAALAYISQILLARWMGAHEYGIFSVAWTWIIILGLLACIGFSSSPAKYIPQYKKTGDFSRLRGFLYTSRLAAFLIASIIAVSGIFILFSLRGYIPTHYVLPMAMVLFCLPLFSVGGVQDGIARSYDWPSLSVLPTYIWRPLGILVILFALMTFGEPATAVTAAGAAVAATWGVALYQMVRLNTRIAQTLPPGPRTNELPLWLAVSLPMLMVEGFLQLITSADVIMVSFWHSPEETAVYFAASKTLALIHFVYFAVRSASAHRFAGFVETNDQAGLRSYVQKSSLWTFGPSLLGGVILLALAPFLLSLFGSGFSAGYPVIAILMLGVLARASIGPVDALLMMTGHQRSCAAIYAATFAVNVVLNVIFIPAFGLAGAAAATSLAICFEAVCLATLARHRLSVTTFVPLILLQRRGA